MSWARQFSVNKKVFPDIYIKLTVKNYDLVEIVLLQLKFYVNYL